MCMVIHVSLFWCVYKQVIQMFVDTIIKLFNIYDLRGDDVGFCDLSNIRKRCSQNTLQL